MTRTAFLAGLSFCGLLLVAAPALAEPEVVATAPATPAVSLPGAQQNIGDQIDTYLKTSPALMPADATGGVTSGDEPRKVHGEVSFAVGSGGYRGAYMRSDFPVGKTGTLSVAVGESRFKGRFEPTQRQSLALGLNFAGAAADGLEPWRRRACLDQQRRSIDEAQAFDVSRSMACPPADATRPVGADR